MTTPRIPLSDGEKLRHQDCGRPSCVFRPLGRVLYVGGMLLLLCWLPYLVYRVNWSPASWAHFWGLLSGLGVEGAVEARLVRRSWCALSAALWAVVLFLLFSSSFVVATTAVWLGFYGRPPEALLDMLVLSPEFFWFSAPSLLSVFWMLLRGMNPEYTILELIFFGCSLRGSPLLLGWVLLGLGIVVWAERKVLLWIAGFPLLAIAGCFILSPLLPVRDVEEALQAAWCRRQGHSTN